MAVGDLVASWERKSLYWGKQTTWGTAVETGFYKVPESSRVWPYQPRPPVFPANLGGSGLPYPDVAYMSQGSPGWTGQTSHPYTKRILADALYLLMQGTTTAYEATSTYISTHVSGGATISWIPDHGTNWKYATIVVVNDGGADPASTLRAHSCIPTQVDITIPQASAGDTGGLNDISISWLGYEATRQSSATLDTPGTDSGTYGHRKEWTFKLGSTAYDFVNASLSLTNGAMLKSNAAGVLLGAFGITGSITLYFSADDATAPALLMDCLEDPADADELQVFHFLHNDGTTEGLDIQFTAIPTGVPTRGEVGGVETLSFNFTMVGESDNYPIIKLDYADFDLLDSTFV